MERSSYGMILGLNITERRRAHWISSEEERRAVAKIVSATPDFLRRDPARRRAFVEVNLSLSSAGWTREEVIRTASSLSLWNHPK